MACFDLFMLSLFINHLFGFFLSSFAFALFLSGNQSPFIQLKQFTPAAVIQTRKANSLPDFTIHSIIQFLVAFCSHSLLISFHLLIIHYPFALFHSIIKYHSLMISLLIQQQSFFPLSLF